MPKLELIPEQYPRPWVPERITDSSVDDPVAGERPLDVRVRGGGNATLTWPQLVGVYWVGSGRHSRFANPSQWSRTVGGVVNWWRVWVRGFHL